MVRFQVTLCALAGLATAFAIALPAAASPKATHAKKATAVAVTAGKPSEFGFALSKKSMPHGTVVFTVKNKGVLPHDFKVCNAVSKKLANACAGKATKLIPAGKSMKLTVKFPKAGTHEYLCTVPGHAANGMKGILKVT